jgi:hypothetical protein
MVHLDHAAPPEKALRFHCQCNPQPEKIVTIYQDTFGRSFCCKACFTRYNPPVVHHAISG